MSKKEDRKRTEEIEAKILEQEIKKFNRWCREELPSITEGKEDGSHGRIN